MEEINIYEKALMYVAGCIQELSDRGYIGRPASPHSRLITEKGQQIYSQLKAQSFGKELTHDCITENLKAFARHKYIPEEELEDFAKLIEDLIAGEIDQFEKYEEDSGT